MPKICVSFRHERKDFHAIADQADLFSAKQQFDEADEVAILTTGPNAANLTLKKTRTEWGDPVTHFCRVRQTNLNFHLIFSGDKRWAVLEAEPAKVPA